MYPIITISGTLGSGKSTIAAMLCKKLNARRIYVGQYMRELARKKHITLAELGKLAENDPSIDIKADKETARRANLLAKKWPVVVEGRVQYHFLPKSIKIFIKASLEQGAKRIWKDLNNEEKNKQRNEAKVKNIAELKQQMRRRKKSELMRYKKYYHLNHLQTKNYDFVLDTSKISAHQAINKTWIYLQKTLNK